MSKIFGDKQLELIEKQIAGNKDDPTGHYAHKVKPKIKEIVDSWLPRWQELNHLLAGKEIEEESKVYCNKCIDNGEKNNIFSLITRFNKLALQCIKCNHITQTDMKRRGKNHD